MPHASFLQLKDKAIKLRLAGKTYSEINKSLGVAVPKSTLSGWCSRVLLSKDLNARLVTRQRLRIGLGSLRAAQTKRARRQSYLDSLFKKNRYLFKLLYKHESAKLVLTALYLGEGSKNARRGAVTFGNSDPKTIALFLRLFRRCYELDGTKFRCTVQCRADQNVPQLEKFWHEVTEIPLSQFYGSRIDKRTIGQKSIKPDYKGVCRIDYFSAEVLNDILEAIKVITGR